MSFYYIIILCQIHQIFSSYLDVDANYRSPKVERNNIVNKGVWVRNYKDSDKTANFLFRGNAIDVDNIVQGDFNAFGDGSANSAFISSYVERNKRSLRSNILKRLKKSPSNANAIEDNSAFVKTKVITKLKPPSVFNDYPYEIAILLDNKEALAEAKNYSAYVISEIVKNESQAVIPLTESNDTKIDEIVSEVLNKSNNASVPKRSMSTYENELNKIEMADDIAVVNNTGADSVKTVERDVSAKEDKPWKQAIPLADSHKYKVLGKNDQTPTNKVVRPVTERGLIKVLSMLTNTFKKIMKQHNEIKDIHKKLNTMNEDFLKNIEIISDKFQDFESKYANLVTFNQKIVELEQKNEIKEQHYRNKEKELSRNLIDFEVQQKKFLTQQRQFYNIQKLMLAQNERINAKQNAIAKTQSEISHRQNNFARILKKAKQVYIDSQSRYNTPKVTPAYVKIDKGDNSNETKADITEFNSQTPVQKEDTTESVKINLFSIPVPTKLKNQDRVLLNEKDEQPVDDLVYKYYFNNTYIDSLMKNFLSGFINTGETSEDVNNVKNKRDEVTEATTILLPVKKPGLHGKIEEVSGKALKRNRRWINKRKKVRKNREKGEIDDEKPVKHQPVRNSQFIEPEKSFTDEVSPVLKQDKKINIQKSDAFVAMATDFCKGIGQNTNAQVLGWCIEKALRRLQNIDAMIPSTRAPTPSSAELKQRIEKKYEELLRKSKDQKKDESRFTERHTFPSNSVLSEQSTTPSSTKVVVTESEITTPPPSTQTPTPVSTEVTTISSLDSFFPDNEKLESNLKKFDIKPDTEGNVYYDGSLHASDYITDDPMGDSRSDFLPGFGDSNSRIDDIDPDTFDSQAKRRAFLKRTIYSRLRYESMLSKVKKL